MAVNPQSAGPKWDGKTRGGSLGHRAIRFLIPITGLGFMYAMISLVVPFYMLFARKGYKAIRDYFSTVWGYHGFKLLKKVYQNHCYFAQGMFDRFALVAGLKDKFQIHFSGEVPFNQMLEKQQGFLIAGSHIGNLELAGMSINHPQKKFYGLVFGMEEEALQQMRAKTLSSNNLDLIPIEKDMSHLVIIRNVLEQGSAVVLHCDRSLLGKKTMELPFMGRPAQFPVGAFHLSYMLSLPVFSIFAMRDKAHSYTVYVKQLKPDCPLEANRDEQIAALCRAYVQQLENQLNNYPEQWYNFFPFWEA